MKPTLRLAALAKSSILATMLVVALVAAAAARPWTAQEVRTTAARKSNVLIQGRIDRALTLDYFLFNDGTGELLLNAANVRQRLAAGDEVVVWGRYVGRSDQYAARPEVDAIDLAAADTADAKRILDAHPNAAPSPSPSPSPSPEATPVPSATPATTPAGRSIEDRLRTLEDLKSKGLVTPAEYDEQRKRILQDL